MKRLMLIIGCAVVAALGAVAGTTNQVAVADVAKSGEAAQSRDEREAQRRQLNDIQDMIRKAWKECPGADNEDDAALDELLDRCSDHIAKEIAKGKGDNASMPECCFVRQIKHGKVQNVWERLSILCQNPKANASPAHGKISGAVLLIAENRTNRLIIITSKANMDIFDKKIAELDVEVETP